MHFNFNPNNYFFSKTKDLSRAQTIKVYTVDATKKANPVILFTFYYTPIIGLKEKNYIISTSKDKESVAQLFKVVEVNYFSFFKDCMYTYIQRRFTSAPSKHFFEGEIEIFKRKDSTKKSYRLFQYITDKNDLNFLDNLRQLIVNSHEIRIFNRAPIIDDSVNNKSIKQDLSNGKIYNSIYNLICLRMIEFFEKEIKVNQVNQGRSLDKVAVHTQGTPTVKDADDSNLINRVSSLSGLDSVDAKNLIKLFRGQNITTKIPWKKSIASLQRIIVTLSNLDMRIILLGDLCVEEYINRHFFNFKKSSTGKKVPFLPKQIQGCKHTKLSDLTADGIIKLFRSSQ